MEIKFISNAAWLLGENFIKLVLGFFVTLAVANYLGASDFGVYNFALGVVSAVTLLISFGMKGILVKEFIQQREKEHILFFNSLIVQIAFSIVLFFLALAIIYNWDVEKKVKLVMLTAMSVVIFHPMTIAEPYFQSKVLSKYIAISNILAFIIGSLLRVSCIRFEFGVVAFSIIYLIESVTRCFLYMVFVKNQSGVNIKLNLIQKIDSSVIKPLLNSSWPYVLSASSYLILMKADQFMLYFLGKGFSSVGHLSLAQTIVMAAYAVGAIITNTYFPQLIRQDGSINEHGFVKLYRVMFLAALFLFICFYFVGSPILMLWLNPDLVPGVSLAVLLMFSVFPSFINLVNGKWYLINGLNTLFLKRAIAVAFINVILNLFFIPMFGVNGCILATIASISFSAFIFDIASSSTRNLKHILLSTLNLNNK